MKKEDFIKVTPKGSKESHIIPASNKAFYQSQDAKVEELTDDDFIEHMGVKKPTVILPVEQTQKYKALEVKLETLGKNIEALKKEIEKKTNENTSLLKNIEALKKEIETLIH